MRFDLKVIETSYNYMYIYKENMRVGYIEWGDLSAGYTANRFRYYGTHGMILFDILKIYALNAI
jgi:hypothetical protein